MQNANAVIKSNILLTWVNQSWERVTEGEASGWGVGLLFWKPQVPRHPCRAPRGREREPVLYSGGLCMCMSVFACTCVHVDACVSVCVHVWKLCAYVHVYVHVYMCAHAYECVCAFVLIFHHVLCIHDCIHVCICAIVCMSVSAHCVPVYVSEHMLICMHVQICVCVGGGWGSLAITLVVPAPANVSGKSGFRSSTPLEIWASYST